MKKLLIGLFAFIFLFIGFQVNATDDGCSSGLIFSSTTGARCPIIPLICPLSMPNPFSLCSDGKIEPATRDANQCVTSYKCVTPKDNEGCSSGVIFNSITGAKCPVIETPVIPTDYGCNGSIFSSTTGARCPVSTIETESGCNGSIFNSITGAKCPVIETPVIPTDYGCNGSIFSSTTGARCSIIVGGDEDSHGCKGSAGYSWCGVKNRCLRTWEEKCEVVVPVEDKGCGAGQVYSLTTGQKCPVINVPVNPVVIKNFNSAFLLISPNPNDQRTQEYKNFLEDLKPKFEQSFKEATYNSATVKVEDIFITNIGSENYLNDPSQLQQDVYSSIKELILKKGDKYDFVNVFTNYDPKLPGNLSYNAKNNVKNIGRNIYDNTKQYGSSGKLIGITIQGDILLDFKKMTSMGILSDTQNFLFGIGNMLHEVGHFWSCHFVELDVCNNSGHLYEGLESPAGTQDVLGTVPWLYNQNDNTYYQDHTGDYPLRYHPITLYSMGLLSKDQYETKFKIFNVGTDGQIKDSGVNISKTISVNDIIKSLGERSIENNIVVPIVPVDTTKDNGCLPGKIFSATTGQTCPIVDNPVVLTKNTDEGCNGANKYSIKTGQVCTNYNGQNIGSGNNDVPNTVTPIRRTLKLGINGEDVKTLQAFLNLLADGSFGPKTQAKVIEWQKANGLTPDGIFGNMSNQKANLSE